MKEDYEPFGDEWRKHMKTLKKELIIDMLKDQGEKRKSEIKHACRIMADLVTDYAYPYEDGTYGDGGMSSVSRAFHFLREYGFAEITDEGTWEVHWKKLEEKP